MMAIVIRKKPEKRIARSYITLEKVSENHYYFFSFPCFLLYEYKIGCLSGIRTILVNMSSQVFNSIGVRPTIQFQM